MECGCVDEFRIAFIGEKGDEFLEEGLILMYSIVGVLMCPTIVFPSVWQDKYLYSIAWRLDFLICSLTLLVILFHRPFLPSNIYSS